MLKSSRRLVISDEAAIDLRDIRRFSIKRWGRRQRDISSARLRLSLASLLDHPERGRPRDEFYRGCRSLLVDQHVVFYYLTADEIVVDRVLHSSQDPTGKVTP